MKLHLFAVIIVAYWSSIQTRAGSPVPVAEARVDSTTFTWLMFDESSNRFALRFRANERQDCIRIWDTRDWKHRDADVNLSPTDATYPYAARFAFVEDAIVLGFGPGLSTIDCAQTPKPSPALNVGLVDGESIHWNVEASSDGKRLIIGAIANERTLTIAFVERKADLGQSRIRRALEVKTGRISAVAVSSDGLLAAIGVIVEEKEQDRYIMEVWDVPNRKRIYVREAHEAWIRALTFSKDGKYLMSGGFDGKLIGWEATTGKVCLSVPNRGAVSSIAIDTSQKLVFFTTFGRRGSDNFRIVDLKNKEIVYTGAVDKTEAHLVGLSPDGSRVATVGSEGMLRIWSIESLLPGLAKNKAKK